MSLSPFTKVFRTNWCAIEDEAAVKFLGNYARSGTTILEELGAEHIRSGNPILYTSAESVLQIAAHEELMAKERLYEICRIARQQADRFRIGRVIARPFSGADGHFTRTSQRHDFSMEPPPTVLEAISHENIPVIGVGKISDIFAGAGITESFPTAGKDDGMRRLDTIWDKLESGFVFTNLVDFDMLYGHRRDVEGYARALENFDLWLGAFLAKVLPNDLMIITATIRPFAGPITPGSRSHFLSCINGRTETWSARNLCRCGRDTGRLFRLAAALAGRHFVSQPGGLTRETDHVTSSHDHYSF